MSPKLQPVRGTHDILPEEFEKFHAVVTHARELAILYGFKEMVTPVFEATEVFSRSMGETSDVVSKEMFTFQTKGEESVTLRPEFTAGIVRAFISNGMQQHLPLKLFSTGPTFRYERPQKGRQRQFHQLNFEWLGDDTAEADVEIILLAGHLLSTLAGKRCTLLLNSLGDKESRVSYRDALVAYLTPKVSELSEESQRRLTKNPLRILDSKDPRDKAITKDAPKITDYLSEASKARFSTICAALTQESIPFFQNVRVEPSLVRGLDYYTDTIFEFVSEEGELGAQNTVLAGGRYDGLVEQMGGKPTSAIGFAAGIERLVLLMSGTWEQVPDTKIVVMPLEEVPSIAVHPLAAVLRVNLMGIVTQRKTKGQHSVEVYWQGKLGKRMEKAAKYGATHVLILGETPMFKDMKTGAQRTISLEFEDLIKLIESIIP